MMDLFKKVYPFLIQFEVGMEKMEEIEILHSFQGKDRSLLLKNEDELGKNSTSREAIHKTHLHSILDQMLSVFTNLELQPLFEADRPKDPGRILDEREVVKNTYHLFFDVFHSSKIIDQLSEGLRIELNGQGVHGKIPPVEVHFDRTSFHGGQSRWRFIDLQASCCKINLQAIREEDDGCPKFFVSANSTGKSLFEFLCQPDPIPLDHDIDVEVFYSH